MVLRRKLPSAMGSTGAAAPAGQPSLDTSASTNGQDSSAPKVDSGVEVSSAFDELPALDAPSQPDVLMADKPTPAKHLYTGELPDIPHFDMSQKAPIAPSAHDKDPFDFLSDDLMDGEMNTPVHEAAPQAPSFAEDSLETNFSHTDEMVLMHEPASEPASKTPSASGGWSLEDLIQEAEPVANFPSLENEDSLQREEEKKTPSSHLPPWQQGATAGEPPILPGMGDADQGDEGDATNKLKMVAGLVLVAILSVGVYYAFVEEKDNTTEKLARITNALEEVSEKPDEALSAFPEMEERRMDSLPEAVTEAVVAKGDPLDVSEASTGSVATSTMIEGKGSFADFPADGEVLEDDSPLPENAVADVISQAKENLKQAQVNASEKTNGTVVEFLDVDEGEVDELITGEEAPEAPPEMNNFFERLRAEIGKAEKERSGTAKVIATPEGEEQVVEIPKVVREQDNKEKFDNLEEELAEYRRVLAGGGGETPKKVTPMEFFEKTAAAQGAGYVDSGVGAIPLPGRSSASPAGVRGDDAANVPDQAAKKAQAASMYGANPYNLPVVPEPSQVPLQKVRTLDDFDVTMFVPEDKRIRMPKNVQPHLNNADFPPVYLLSLVPGQGVIAQNRGVQGALMIGETVDGWELVTVASGYAEFRKGKRRHVLTLDGVRQ